MRSPIERMIDEAVASSMNEGAYVLLRCPRCLREARTQLVESDPDGTVKIIYPCPTCEKKPHELDPVYLDVNGKELKHDED